MKANYNNASYPPAGPWDRRLTEVVCPALSPVEVLHENPWFTVRRRGAFYTAEYRMPQVIVLPVVEHEAFVMVRVKRPVLDDITLELPAGGMEPGEAPEAGAARELAEEAGIDVGNPSRLVPMPPLAMSPNRMPKLVYVFRVDLQRHEFEQRRPHDHEVDSVELVPFAEAVRLMTTGGIYVAGIIAIISMYLSVRNTLNVPPYPSPIT
jgi:8-oxo-dGTP pyrophosphatase MutT (NUDIX family)